MRIDVVYTICYGSQMANHNLLSQSEPRPAKPPISPRQDEAKGTVNLRIEAYTRQLIDQAAVALGKTRTEFMIESARSSAIDVLLDQRLFLLDADRFDAFVSALDHPPEPGPKLQSLLRRVPAWQT
jgi:uncharacterized protein (DUF1778 family)